MNKHFSFSNRKNIYLHIIYFFRKKIRAGVVSGQFAYVTDELGALAGMHLMFTLVIEWDMIVVTVFLLILNKIKFHLV